MKITATNYAAHKPSRGSLTDAEQAGYDLIEMGGLDLYGQDADITDAIDLYLVELNHKYISDFKKGKIMLPEEEPTPAGKARKQRPTLTQRKASGKAPAQRASKPAPKPAPAAPKNQFDGLHPYIFFYNNKKVEMYATGLYAAKQQAIAHFKVKKSQEHLVHGALAVEDKPSPAAEAIMADNSASAPAARRKASGHTPAGRHGAALPKKKPAPAPIPAPAPKATRTKTKKEAAPKAAKAPKVKEVDARTPVSHFDNDVVFMQSFLKLVGKPATFTQVKGLHEKLEKAITKQFVRKGSLYADDMAEMASLVAKTLQHMKDEEIGSIGKLQYNNPVVDRVRAHVEKFRIDGAINLLSRFINMQGTAPTDKAVSSLLTALQNEYQAHPKGDHALAIGAAAAVLSSWKPGRAVAISRQQLGALSGLGCPDTPSKPCGCSKKAGR